jgi:hypothetical protein
MNRRPFTRAEIDAIRRHYAGHDTLTVRELAARLGRNRKVVSKKARDLGVSRKRFIFTQEVINEFRALHAAGWSDAEISRKLGICPQTVMYRRRRLGLLPNPPSPLWRRRQSDHMKRICNDNGVKSLVEIRHLAEGIESFRAGWPEDVSRSSRRVLDVMERYGRPVSAVELKRELGLTLRPQDALETLRAQGYIEGIGKRGSRLFQYRLAIARRSREIIG